MLSLCHSQFIDTSALGNLRITQEEIQWLRKNCSYLPDAYLDYLQLFRVYPEKQVDLQYNEETRDISIIMHGRWIDTILYEIPVLALVSESYFRFVDRDWDYVGQFGISFSLSLPVTFSVYQKFSIFENTIN